MKCSPRAAGITAIVLGISAVLWSQTTSAIGQTYTDVAGTSAAKGAQSAGPLAFTGSSSMTITLAFIGVGFVVVGVLFLLRGRMAPSKKS
jgi:hypothetical protein